MIKAKTIWVAGLKVRAQEKNVQKPLFSMKTLKEALASLLLPMLASGGFWHRLQWEQKPAAIFDY